MPPPSTAMMKTGYFAVLGRPRLFASHGEPSIELVLQEKLVLQGDRRFPIRQTRISSWFRHLGENTGQYEKRRHPGNGVKPRHERHDGENSAQRHERDDRHFDRHGEKGADGDRQQHKRQRRKAGFLRKDRQKSEHRE